MLQSIVYFGDVPHAWYFRSIHILDQYVLNIMEYVFQ
jgi:hypothetical protein